MQGHSRQHTTMRTPAPKAGRRQKAATGASLAAALLCTHNVQATHDVCTISGDSVTVVHVVGTFKPDSKKKDFLTDWIEVSEPDAWNCTRKFGTAGTTYTWNVGLAVGLNERAQIQAGWNLDVDGQTYDVFKSKAGLYGKELVGYIMARRYEILSKTSSDCCRPALVPAPVLSTLTDSARRR